MGLGGISIWQLLILLLIIVMVFGTKKLRNMGSDLGAAVKGFRQGMESDKSGEADRPESHQLESETASPTSASQPAKKESTPN